jgi:hypothetical protein
MYTLLIFALGIAIGYILRIIGGRIKGPEPLGDVVVKRKLNQLLSIEVPHTLSWFIVQMDLMAVADKQTLHALLVHDTDLEVTDTPEGPAYRVKVYTHA